MSGDLTRWNRAGLTRIQYVNGNAATFLELLRESMRTAFTDAGGKLRWTDLGEDAAEETPPQRRERLLAQYHGARRDHGWEILRTLARASHVLAGHLDAYANESSIRTATQWDNLRRLVEMLDYHPAPPASAETTLALLAKDGASGTVETGFACKNQPADGSAPVVFETLEDLEVDAALNALRPRDWDRSPEEFRYETNEEGVHGAHFPLSSELEGVSAGARGVLLIESADGARFGLAVQVTAADADGLELEGDEPPATIAASFPGGVRRHQVRVLLAPQFKATPHLVGDNVVTLSSDHGLSAGAAVAWSSGGWRAAFVEAVEGNRVRLSGAVPGVGARLYMLLSSSAQDHEDFTKPRTVVPLPRAQTTVWDAGLLEVTSLTPAPDVDPEVALYEYSEDHPLLYFAPEVTGGLPSVQGETPRTLTVAGDGGGLSSGDWVLVEKGGAWVAASVAALEEGSDEVEIQLADETLAGPATALFGDFAVEARPADWNVNTEVPWDEGESSSAASWLPLEAEELPASLEVGRRLVVQGAGGAAEVFVKELDEPRVRVRVAPALAGDGFTRHATTIHGNAVRAGHGESRPAKILGSGDATRSSQIFVLDAPGVSFIADAGQASGVRAALELGVGRRVWTQVASLNDSAAEDPHFETQLTEEGTLELRFGDGTRGRRLPTGSNNVRVSYRVGAGTGGNLDAGSLTKEVKPHHLLDGLVQLLVAAGGNDLEPVSSLRENAPASVLTLERAVSVRDFEHLAATNSRVWQAHAYRLPPGVGRGEKIEVAVVPAGGGVLGTLKGDLVSFLLAHAAPGVEVTVVSYEAVVLDLDVTVQVILEEYDQDEVATAVRAALLEAFSLERSTLGGALYRSRVFEVVESVEGVENCVCAINVEGFRGLDTTPVTPRFVAKSADGTVRSVSVEEWQVLHADEDESRIQITTEGYRL